jgi:hypothetical protein
MTYDLTSHGYDSPKYFDITRLPHHFYQLRLLHWCWMAVI